MSTSKRRQTTKQSRARHRYWLTPRAWNRSCSHCGASRSIAFRHTPRTYACGSCVEGLGIKAGESRAWSEGGVKDPTLTIRYVDPAILQSDR